MIGVPYQRSSTDKTSGGLTSVGKISHDNFQVAMCVRKATGAKDPTQNRGI